MRTNTISGQKERPIIFKAEMVRAILDGRKTQTRRIVADKRLSPKLTLLESFDFLGGGGRCDSSEEDGLRVSFVRDCDRQDENGRRYKYTGLLVQSEAVPEDGAEEISCPYGSVGDRLWVKETHYRYGRWVKNGKTKTGQQAWRFKATPAHLVHFPMEAFKPAPIRTSLGWHKRPSIFMPRWASRITLEITKVRAERLQDISESDITAEGTRTLDYHKFFDPVAFSGYTSDFRELYRRLWDSINGDSAWEKNPWVWVIDVCRVDLPDSASFIRNPSALRKS